MKRLIADFLLLLFTAACGSSYHPTPTTPSTPTAPVSTAGPIAPVPGPTLVPGGEWSCDDGEGDVCVAQGVVSGDDPVCFNNWDATGHCKQYEIVAPAEGTLSAMMRWAGPSRGLYDPDLFLVAPDGGFVYSPDSWPEKRASIRVAAGRTYRIVVLSYGPTRQVFALTLNVPGA